MPKPSMDNNAPLNEADTFEQLKEKYSIKSLLPEEVKKTLANVNEICADFDKLNFENAPERLIGLKAAVKKYKNKAAKMARHEKNIGLDEFGDLVAASDDLISQVENYKEYAEENPDIPGMEPETLETINRLKICVKAVDSNYEIIKNTELKKKSEELTGDMMATYNKLADSMQYTGEKYKDAKNRPIGKEGYSIHRSAGETLTVLSMIIDGYTVEQTLDPGLCVEEKQKRYDKYVQLMGNSSPENQKEIAKTLYNGYKKVTEKIDETAREIDFSKADIRDKKYCMLLRLAFHRFDAGQETQHCRDEILEISQKDNPEYKRYDDFIQVSDGGALISCIDERYNKLSEYAAYAALDRNSPDEDTANLLATKMFIKHYEDLLSKGQKAAPDKNPQDWVGQGEILNAFQYDSYLKSEFTNKLKELKKEPELAQSMAGGIATGKLFTKNKLGGKETEIEFSIDRAKGKFEVKNFPHSLMIKEIAEKEYMKTQNPVEHETLSHLDELAAKHDVQGLVDFTQKIIGEYMRDDLPPKETEEANLRMDAYSDFSTYLHNKCGKNDLSKEDRQFFLEFNDKLNGMRNGIIMDLGLKTDAMENEIRKGNIQGTELLKDNHKIARAMAHEFIAVRSNLPERKQLDILDRNIQIIQRGLEGMKLTPEEKECNMDGLNYKSNGLIDDPALELIHKRNWKINYELALKRGDVDVGRLKLYGEELTSLGPKAANKYDIGIESENGKFKLTSLPKDIIKIQSSAPEQLQQYRDELLRERGLMQTMKGAVSDISGWSKKMLDALNETHKEKEDDSAQMKRLRSRLNVFKNDDSGTSFDAINKDLDELMKAASELERTNTGLFGGDQSIERLCRNIQSFGHAKKAEFSGLSTNGLKNLGSIDMAISGRTETLRRLDKYAELNGIDLKKNDELSFTPSTDQRLDEVGRLLEQAKKGVFGGSKEYDAAVRSFAEITKAYKDFRRAGEKATDVQRIKAIEEYHEASAKARLDLDKYLKYREAKGPLENNRDTKTQKRIDSIKAAISVLQDTNAFMDDRYTESTRRMLAADNKVIAAQQQAEKSQKQQDYTAQADAFRKGLENKPSYLKYLIKGVKDAMDTLGQISAGDPDAALTDAEKEEAAKAMAAMTLYTTYDHAKKNDQGFAVPLTEDRLRPMIDQLASQSAFKKAAGGIETREDIRKVMANPDELRQKYTLAAVAEKQQQKNNAEILANHKEQPQKEMDLNNDQLNKGLK